LGRFSNNTKCKLWTLLMKPRILVVDDEKNIRRSMQMILSSEGYPVSLAGNAREALDLLKKEFPDIIFLDVMLPDRDGLSLLPEIKSNYPATEIIMISGHANLSMAVEATRAGAYDFLEKPLQKEKILLTIQHLLEKHRLQEQYESLEKELGGEYQMIGESKDLLQVKQQISRVAGTDSKVLILGESGTGKELVAWSIHHQSQRSDGPFVKMNCAAIPEDLTESELFGHEKGAFTGAGETRDGKFLQAHQGTIFLDEIADMSLRVQTKVLRVLQDGRFERVGGNTALSTDTRVIAATNKNLEELVKNGLFREDLYFRLNVFPIRIPPLRSRKEDVPLLVDHFIRKYCLRNNRRPVSVEPRVYEILKNYAWPGNIRELQNIVERLLILTTGKKILLKDLPSHLLQPAVPVSIPENGAVSLKEVRETAERDYIQKCLAACGGNVSETARMLGLERTNLHKKMKALGIK
jgi:two-component system nitrogen regulation response regulator NtrX